MSSRDAAAEPAEDEPTPEQLWERERTALGFEIAALQETIQRLCVPACRIAAPLRLTKNLGREISSSVRKKLTPCAKISTSFEPIG